HTHPYDVVTDKNGEAWTGGMTTDRIVRLDPKTGQAVEYPLPRNTNMRRAFVGNSTNPPTFWVGSNHGASLVKGEPLGSSSSSWRRPEIGNCPPAAARCRAGVCFSAAPMQRNELYNGAPCPTVAIFRRISMTYWAFISYSHRDTALATWLHRSLETYRIPSK